MDINTDIIRESIRDKSNISGSTHNFYNYPARFSPRFAKEVIRNFSRGGDLILDPFMGGGTTLIEAANLGRHSAGFDISTLASFISRVKTTQSTEAEIDIAASWFFANLHQLNCHHPAVRPDDWIVKGYQRNLSNRQTWPIRKLMEQFLSRLKESNLIPDSKDFLRCVLLRTGQWALDSKREIPSANEFKLRLEDNFVNMSLALLDYTSSNNSEYLTLCFNKPAKDIPLVFKQYKLPSPKLIVTSPPYPGIHVLYHRWQIHSRRETPAPFWISNCEDGQGLSFYTMGDRQQPELRNYYENIFHSFHSISKVCTSETLVFQVLAFSNPEWQLPKYLDTMNKAGFVEIKSDDGARIWRDVPNRKWYAQNKGATTSSKEVVLIHRFN